MPRIRTKAYRRGDRFTVQIPLDASTEMLEWINSQKYLSPAIIKLLKEKTNTSIYEKELHTKK